MAAELLFVYGTLRPGSSHPLAKRLAEQGDYFGTAIYQGRMYLIGHYPGVVPSPDPADRVHGDLYRLAKPGSLLRELDAYEECGEGFAAPSEYRRAEQPVLDPEGQPRLAWIYLYNWPTDNLTFIPSGDFSAAR